MCGYVILQTYWGFIHYTTFTSYNVRRMSYITRPWTALTLLVCLLCLSRTKVCCILELSLSISCNLYHVCLSIHATFPATVSVDKFTSPYCLCKLLHCLLTTVFHTCVSTVNTYKQSYLSFCHLLICCNISLSSFLLIWLNLVITTGCIFYFTGYMFGLHVPAY